MAAVARLGVMLLAAYLVVVGLGRLAALPDSWIRNGLVGDPVGLGTLAIYTGLALVAFGVFAVVPAVVLFRLAPAIADRLFPESSPAAPLSSEATYGLGCVLMGLYFIVQGAAYVVDGTMTMTMLLAYESKLWREQVGTVIHGVVLGGAGLALYRHGLRWRS